MKTYSFGVDLGGTNTKFGLFRTDGALLEHWEIPTRTAECGKAILPDIAAAVLGKLAQRGIDRADVQGVGVGVPGAVTCGSHVARCVNLNQWGDFDVASELATLCGLPVKVGNDANVAALGEMWQGGGKGMRNVVFVTLGTGVGGGIVVDGRLLEGVHGAGGEIGHIKVFDNDENDCGCGKRGCLEQFGSATGLVRSARRRLAKNADPSTLRDVPELTAKAVFDAAKAGDSVALELVDAFADILGRAFATVACVCDPDVFVIGGGVSAAGELLLQRIRERYVRYAFPATEGTGFRLSELGNQAGIYGCARMMLDE